MIPDSPGTYVLILHLSRSAEDIRIGRLGQFRFPSGWYAYVGSARGPGGLAARLARHLRQAKPLHWHIDYLRAQVQPVKVWYATGTQKRECAWARALSGLPGASLPVPGFGASDCPCSAHLIYFAKPPGLAFADVLGERMLQEVL
jgi:Uri superfamily endonuclease